VFLRVSVFGLPVLCVASPIRTIPTVGTHVGHICSKAVVLVGTVTFIGESASDWQQVNFATSTAVTVNRIDASPLHAFAKGVDGFDGTHLYFTTEFPTNSCRSTNYWINTTFTPQITVGSPQLTSGETAFGGVAVNSNGSRSATLTPPSAADAVTVTSVSVTTPEISLVVGSLPAALQPGDLMRRWVEVKPSTAAAVNGQFKINSNAVAKLLNTAVVAAPLTEYIVTNIGKNGVQGVASNEIMVTNT
jgi:hypothetical protein